MLFPPEENEIILVDVAIPVPLRMLFTYKVPLDLNIPVNKGFRVLVPFRSKLIYGITMTEAYTKPAEEVLPKTRELVSYDSKHQVLTPEIGELLEWVVKYYKAPVGEALKLAFPPGILSEKEALFHLSEKGTRLGLQSQDRTILGLIAHEQLSQKEWSIRAKKKIQHRDIRRWESLGFFEVSARGGECESIPHVAAIYLTDLGRTADLSKLGRAAKQKELLKWLRQMPLYASYTELRQAFPSASSLLSSLIKKGFCAKKQIPKYELYRQIKDFIPDSAKTLTEEQERALAAIQDAQRKNEYRAFLIFGVTGSGKTEIYLRAIQNCLDQGKQALFLVPEIGLTPLMQRRIGDRFGERLAILHSAVSMSLRADSWAKILSGKVDVVLGARSSVFAPMPRLGLVIIDEEHDQSYKQNDRVRYHARDLAMVRAKMAKVPIVLGSATPSLESWLNYENGRLCLLTLKTRATNAPLPRVEVIDMREEFKAQRRRPILSRYLENQIQETLQKGHQAMILINRRGYFSFLLCRKCGKTVTCSQCEVSLTFHQTDKRLKCHYCGENQAPPESCPACGEHIIQYFGEGTQQIQELLQKKYPSYVVDRLDRDRTTAKDAHQKILSRFEKRESQVLVGTQIIAKGHDFPNVTLVGIINADQGLRIPDFRSAEASFQLLTQVAGRSGRGQNPGSVVIQTYMPDHYSIVHAAKHDFLGFLEKERRYRKRLFYSPFASMIAVLITHRNQEKAACVSKWVAAEIGKFHEKVSIVVLGPIKAPIGKIKNVFRYQIVLKSSNRRRLHTITDAVIEEAIKQKLIARSSIILDIDPYQFF